MNKAQRVEVFFQRLEDAPPCTTGESAYALLCETLNHVEDQLSGIPYNPANWADDGRLYPPQLDRMSVLSGGIWRFRSLCHVTLIAPNGAIRIARVGNRVHTLLDKPGADGGLVPMNHKDL